MWVCVHTAASADGDKIIMSCWGPAGSPILWSVWFLTIVSIPSQLLFACTASAPSLAQHFWLICSFTWKFNGNIAFDNACKMTKLSACWVAPVVHLEIFVFTINLIPRVVYSAQRVNPYCFDFSPSSHIHIFTSHDKMIKTCISILASQPLDEVWGVLKDQHFYWSYLFFH